MRNLLATKVNFPVLSGPITLRHDLIAQLNHGLDKKLTLICAPAGFGKTTLLIHWAETLKQNPPTPGVEIRTAWYTLDETDNHLTTFVSYLAAALQNADAGAFSDWSMLSKLPNLPGTEELAADILRGSELIKYKLIVILDDYHFITDRNIHQLVNHCLRYLSPKIHVVISARQDPPLILSQLRAQHQLNEIRIQRLAFSLDETRTFFTDKLKRKIDPAVIQVIWERTEGWVAGLQLASIPLSISEDPQSFINQFQKSSTRYIMDYLVDEVLHHQKPEVHNFLLKTSILSALCSQLCGTVVEIETSSSQQILEDLERRNIFIVALDDQRKWFRYHTQFQAMLSNHLRIHYSASEIADLHNRAATWYERQGSILDALRHYIAADNFNGAIELIVPRLPDLFQNERWNELRSYQAILPQQYIEKRPELSLMSAWLCVFDSNRDEAMRMIENAERLLSQFNWPEEQTRALRGQVHALMCNTLFATEPAEQAIAHGNLALELLSAQYRWARAFAVTCLTQWQLMTGKGAIALNYLEYEIAASSPAPSYYLVRLYYALANLHFLNGDVHALLEVSARYEELANQLSLAAELKWAQWVKAWIYLERNQFEPALEELHAIFTQPEINYFQTLRLATYALLRINETYACASQVVNALTILRVRLGSHPDPNQRNEVEALEALWAWEQNDLNAVERWVTTAETNPSIQDLAYRGWILVRLQMELFKAGRFPNAIELAEKRLAYHQQNQFIGAQVPLLVELAQAYWFNKQARLALSSLRSALELGYPRGLRNTFSVHSPAMREMLHQLAQEAPFTAIVADLLQGTTRSIPTRRQVISYQDERIEFLNVLLTEREADILKLLAMEFSNKEIAVQLRISPYTARNHMAKIFKKLQVKTRRQALLVARKRGWLS